MSKRALCSLVVVLLVCLPACFTHRYSGSPGAALGAQVYKQWHHHYLFGLISSKNELDISRLCPSGNVHIEDKHTFVNQLLGGLTLGIWSPTTVTVRCADGSGAMQVEIDETTARLIVTDPLFLQIVGDLYPERVAELQMALRRQEMTSKQASITPSGPPARY